MLKTIRFNYIGSTQEFIAPINAEYTFETYGGQGGAILSGTGGKGGYAKGRFTLKKGNVVYINVGGSGDSGGWNGGGSASAYGGGATDARLINSSNVLDKESLLSRIIVAGGGGGGERVLGGAGGGLNGLDCTQSYNTTVFAKGGTQTKGGKAGASDNYGYGQDGGFGYGGHGNAGDPGSGGGGGWYGGGGITYAGGGGGGSSYIDLLHEGTTTSGVNSGNGYMIITYNDDDKRFFLKKEDKYYIPTKEFYEIDTNNFIPVDINDIMIDAINNIDNPNNLKCVDIRNINSLFKLDDGKKIIPSDILNFNKCNICIITDEVIDTLKLIYFPNLLKSNIKLKEEFRNVTYKNYINITSNDESRIDYTMSYSKDYKNCSILDTEILKNFSHITFRFNDKKGNLSNISLSKYNEIKLIELKSSKFKCVSDLLNTSLNFKYNYNKILINKLTKQKFKYSTDRLETF